MTRTKAQAAMTDHRLVSTLLVALLLLPAIGCAEAPDANAPATRPASDANAAATAPATGPRELRTERSYWDRARTQIRAERTFDGNVPHGTWVFYSPRGQKTMEIPFVEGKVQGTYKKYYDGTGRPLVFAEMRDDQPHGMTRRFYDLPDSPVEYEVPFKEGKQHGTMKRYSDKGIVVQETPYVRGTVEGIEREYHNSGRLRAEIPYKGGRKHGVEKVYTRGKRLIWTKHWVQGKLHGVVKAYRPDTGQVHSEERYVHGEKVSAVFYDKAGNVVSQTQPASGAATQPATGPAE